MLLGVHDHGKLRALLTLMIDGATVSCRSLAAELGISKNTVWRWRSTIMAALETLDVPAPEPIVAVDLHVVRESRKASREWARHAADPLGSPPPDRPRWIDVDRGRQAEPLPRAAYRVPMVAVLGSGQHCRAERWHGQEDGASNPVAPACRDGQIATALDESCNGHLARHATAAVSRRPPTGEASGDVMCLDPPGELLRRFLHPFRGPATRHLRGYLAWFTATRPAASADRDERAWVALLSLRPTRLGDMRPAPA